MARDIRATPAHKRTEVPTRTELANKRSKSPPECRRVPEDDKVFLPLPPTPPAVVITDSPSPVNDHDYYYDCNKLWHLRIICPFLRRKTCRKCEQPGHNITTCGRPRKNTICTQKLKPLPENTPLATGPSDLHLIQKCKVCNCCSAPTPDHCQILTHDQPCELCKGYGHQTKNCYITHRNSRYTFKSTNDTNFLGDNQLLQLELYLEVKPNLRIAQWMLDKQVCEAYEALIRRD